MVCDCGCNGGAPASLGVLEPPTLITPAADGCWMQNGQRLPGSVKLEGLEVQNFGTDRDAGYIFPSKYRAGRNTPCRLERWILHSARADHQVPRRHPNFPSRESLSRKSRKKWSGALDPNPASSPRKAAIRHTLPLPPKFYTFRFRVPTITDSADRFAQDRPRQPGAPAYRGARAPRSRNYLGRLRWRPGAAL